MPNGNEDINPNLPVLRGSGDIEPYEEAGTSLVSRREISPKGYIERGEGLEEESLTGSPSTRLSTSERGIIEGTAPSVSRGTTGILTGSDVQFEGLSPLEEEIQTILEDGRILTVRGIKDKLTGDFGNTTEEEIDVALTNLVGQGLVNEISTGRYQAVIETSEEVEAAKERAGTARRDVTSGVKSFFGKGGKGRKIGEASVMEGARGIGFGKRFATKGAKAASGFVGEKAPFVGSESRERKAQEEAFWKKKFEQTPESSDLPPSMRKGARKRFQESYLETEDVRDQAKRAGIGPDKYVEETIWDQKKQRAVKTGRVIKIPKTGSDIRQELLDLELKTQEKKGDIALARFVRKKSEKLLPSKKRQAARAVGSFATGLGKAGVIVSKGTVATTKGFGQAPRISRTSGLTGSDSPLVYEGSGGQRLREATRPSIGYGLGSGQGRLRQATIPGRAVGGLRSQSLVTGRVERLNPFPKSRRINPSGSRINPIGKISKPRGIGKPRPMPLF